MKRKIILILFILAFAGATAFFYVNKVILPLKLKAVLIEKIQELSGRRVTVASVAFSLLKGFVVNDLTIFERDLGQTSFIHIPKLTFRILYLSILKDKKVVIP